MCRPPCDPPKRCRGDLPARHRPHRPVWCVHRRSADEPASRPPGRDSRGTVGGVVDPAQLRHSALSLALARADLAYVHGALMRDPDPTSRWVFLQYGVMSSYETRQYMERQLQAEAPEALWPEETAKAARMSGKYFDDKRRFLAGVEAYFDELMATNRATFFPEGRRAKWLDALRSDMAVLLLDGVPVASNVGSYFSAGLSPDHLVDADTLGLRIHDLAAGVGQTISWLRADRTHVGPLPFDPARFVWRDTKAVEFLGRAFGGDFRPPMAAAMLTVQNAATAAHRLARTDCCEQCRAAAFKHRLIVAYQSTVALRHVQEGARSLSQRGQEQLERTLSEPACELLLGGGYRKLRNGLLHLGLTDVPVSPGAGLSLREVIRHYTGSDAPEVVKVVDQALEVVTRALENWYLAGPTGSRGS